MNRKKGMSVTDSWQQGGPRVPAFTHSQQTLYRSPATDKRVCHYPGSAGKGSLTGEPY